jgi:hypothetical protein
VKALTQTQIDAMLSLPSKDITGATAHALRRYGLAVFDPGRKRWDLTDVGKAWLSGYKSGVRVGYDAIWAIRSAQSTNSARSAGR